ncbi:hypothetical protein EYF80_022729 [Liparis tanakae]|uniref:Uncharacterized protein n=1 Tax=Liparis tanakae TaxID=230148 RepID=A0A4Z2HQ10_9TELE|nr:hypothetical protein EYF80_022729 [Liparis tanakae]
MVPRVGLVSGSVPSEEGSRTRAHRYPINEHVVLARLAAVPERLEVNREPCVGGREPDEWDRGH